MTFRLDNIIEEWAALYKPIAHDKAKGSKDKRFFRIKTISADNEFGRNANMVKSPCVLFSVLVDAQTKGRENSVDYRYEIYFASKAVARSLAKNAKQDGDAGTDQQLAMDDMVQDLLAYLWRLRRDGINPVTNAPVDAITWQGLKGLQLDKAEWASLPVKFNEWHIMGLSITGLSPRLLCVRPSLYAQP